MNWVQPFNKRYVMATAKMLNQRKSKRYEAKSGIAITPHGIGQVININRNGLAFKCVEERDFPVEWSMAIYDITGQRLEQLQVTKVWEKDLGSPKASSPFAMEVGGEFVNLSSAQKAQLNIYLQQLVEKE